MKKRDPEPTTDGNRYLVDLMRRPVARCASWQYGFLVYFLNPKETHFQLTLSHL